MQQQQGGSKKVVENPKEKEKLQPKVEEPKEEEVPSQQNVMQRQGKNKQ